VATLAVSPACGRFAVFSGASLPALFAFEPLPPLAVAPLSITYAGTPL
jgi:ABC-type nitrate/sulfonate/bicarbonate transport system permease component